MTRCTIVECGDHAVSMCYSSSIDVADCVFVSNKGFDLFAYNSNLTITHRR